jgi:opacity protein-like surface antigen
MNIRYTIRALALASCVLAAPAMAGEDDEGAYVFLSGGSSFAFHGCASPLDPSGTDCSGKSIAFRAGFGYQYTPTWGLEVSYGQFGFSSSSGFANFAAPPVGPGPGNYAWQLKATGLAVQAVATLHMSDNLAVYGKFGIARVEYDEALVVASWNTGFWSPPNPINAKKNSPALAAGARYDFDSHTSVMLGAEYYGQFDVYNLNKQVRLTVIPVLSLRYQN